MDILAPRMTRFKPSASTETASLARALRAEGREIVDFSIGEPDFETPENVKAAVRRAMDLNETHYTNTGGTAPLVEAIREKFLRENNLSFEADEIVVSAGAKHTMFNAFMCTVTDGDEIIVPVPYWISYPNQVLIAGGVPVLVNCSDENGFILQAEDLEAAITDKTKWVVLNSPGNPTGVIYQREDLRRIADVLLRYPDIWIMTDEIYEHFLYDGARHVSILEIEPSLKKRTVVVNGVSKAYAMTGWRIGYAGAPKQLVKAMVKFQSQSTSCPSSISQAAAVEALTGPQDVVQEQLAIMQDRRNAVFEGLNQVEGLIVKKPQGAMYLFCDCRGLFGRRTPNDKKICSDQDVAAHLLDSQGVSVVPGVAYGLDGYFRLSFATSIEVLDEGTRRIRDACNMLK